MMDERERREFDEWVRHVRETTVKGMVRSAYVMQLAPPEDAEPDIKFAVELGLSILMDKPIIVLVPRGRTLLPKLARIADAVVEMECDLDTEAGQMEAGDKVMAAMARLDGESS